MGTDRRGSWGTCHHHLRIRQTTRLDDDLRKLLRPVLESRRGDCDREATRFPFGLRRPPTLACSGFALRSERSEDAARAGSTEWPRSSLRASASALRQWRRTADACRYAARNRQACAPLALHFAPRSQCLAWTFAPPLLLCDGHTAKQCARKHRPASHAPLANARSLSASGLSGLQARIANRRQTVQPQADVCQFGCAVATKKPGHIACYKSPFCGITPLPGARLAKKKRV